MFPTLVNPFTWWQWLILAAVPPAIVALYFLKLKRRPIEVPSTYLWHKSIEDLHVNSIWQRLRRNLLLLLQLLLWAILLGTVLQPGFQAETLPGHRFVFLVDNSASMQATDVAPTRLDEAKRQALEAVDQMAGGDVAMVVAFNDSARVEQVFTSSRAQLRRAIQSIEPTVHSTSLVEALRVASGQANPPRISEPGNPRDVQVAEPLPATLLIFSDGRFEGLTGIGLTNLDPIYRPVGAADTRNVGIVAMSVDRHETRPDRLEAFARLQNFSSQPIAVSLEWMLNDRTINYDRVELEAEGSSMLVQGLEGAESGTLRLRATTSDLFPLDDQASVVVDRPRQARVLLVTSGNERLQSALTTAPALELAQVSVQSPAFLQSEPYRQKAASGEFDLIIYDRCQPAEMPRANTLFIGAIPPGDAWQAGPAVRMPQIIDLDTTHPLTQWMDLSRVIVAEATPLKPPPGARVLIDSHLGPLLGISPRESFEDAVLAFVIVDSRKDASGTATSFVGTDWFKYPSFPSFVLNLLEYFGRSRGDSKDGTHQPGQLVTLTFPQAVQPLEVRTPAGRVLKLKEDPDGKVVFADTSELGIYEASSGGKNVGRFAVNLFHASESDIRTRPDILIDRVPVSGVIAPQISRLDLWKGLLLAGLVVLLLEWYVYSRRVAL